MTDDNIEPGEFEWGTTPNEAPSTEESQSQTYTLVSAEAVKPVLERSRPLALVVVLLSMGAIFALSGGATADTDFTAANVNVTSHAGQISQLSVAPTGQIHYRGFESNANTVNVEVAVKLSSDTTWETIGSTSLTASGKTGNITYDMNKINVLTSSSLSNQDFKATDGNTATTDVDIRVTATFVGVGPGGSDVTTTASDTFSVEVTNIAAGGGVHGNANTDGA